MQIRKLIINMFKNGDQIWFPASFYSFLSFLFFIFITTIANSFVERGVKVASAAVVSVVVVIKYSGQFTLSMVCRIL